MSGSQRHPRTAMVTGASSGIGEEYARRLAERGFALVLVARRADRLERLAAELRADYGVDVTAMPADLGDEDGLAAVESRLRDDGDAAPIDLLVNNAGRGHGGDLADLDPAAIDAVIGLNVRALVRLTRAVLPGQIRRAERRAVERPEPAERRVAERPEPSAPRAWPFRAGGGGKRGGERSGPIGVLNVASVAALLPASPGGTVYGASKAFVRSFSHSVAVEAAPHGVTVTVVLPGYVRTDMTVAVQRMGLPGIAFVDKERVVVESLRAWAAGASEVIPGMPYKAAGGLLRVVPGELFRQAVRRLGIRRMGNGE
ncbi:SDR family NAD(P)-dependent oxidoreductase [Marinactinospora rubrisoli]|uniref:SDR family NAD(P)-dependent oxidoreductase n=1 Tax=Marinactinospora rubrisoli TaxID=2715399 RepID=A0ABW2KA11_9ACTN